MKQSFKRFSLNKGDYKNLNEEISNTDWSSKLSDYDTKLLIKSPLVFKISSKSFGEKMFNMALKSSFSMEDYITCKGV